MRASRIIVIGTSAGGREALRELLSRLPAKFPAAIFIVQHMAPDANAEVLIAALKKTSSLPCKQAEHGESIRGGQVYVARPDHHTLVGKGTVVVSKGARENRSRPGIDPLFRSAAVAYDSRVIAVLLTGFLDDGTAGMDAVKKCGGICIVQDPKEAAYPDMPENALNNVKIDYCLPLREIANRLVELASSGSRKSVKVPQNVATEAKIAERVLSDVSEIESLGTQVPFNCPNCAGVLWEVKGGVPVRYRCHTGHAFTAAVLLAEQTKNIEETLWIGLRMFEERKNLLSTLMAKEQGNKKSMKERIEEHEIHIERIRAMLRASTEIPSEPLAPKRKKRG